MSIILAGGGSEQDSREVDQFFADQLPGGCKMLYIPTALKGDIPMEDCLSWISNALKDFDISIHMEHELSNLTNMDLSDFSSIYIGGGNTFYLLDEIKKNKLEEAFISFHKRGGVIYGGSAGAIILGNEISICEIMDENLVDLKDLSAFNQAAGFSIWCHYRKGKDDGAVEEYMASKGNPVIAIPEDGGCFIQNNLCRSIGKGEIRIFRDGEPMVLKMGEELSL